MTRIVRDTYAEGFFQSQGTQDIEQLLLDLANRDPATNTYTREQAIADTQGLIAQSMRDFNNNLLPQITNAQEGAGASGGALTALLAQNAAAAQAGQVAEKQLAQILAAEKLQSHGRDQQVGLLEALLQQSSQSDRDRLQFLLGRMNNITQTSISQDRSQDSAASNASNERISTARNKSNERIAAMNNATNRRTAVDTKSPITSNPYVRSSRRI